MVYTFFAIYDMGDEPKVTVLRAEAVRAFKEGKQVFEHIATTSQVTKKVIINTHRIERMVSITSGSAMKTTKSERIKQTHGFVHSTVVAATLHKMHKKNRVSVRSLVRDRAMGKKTPIDSIADAIEQIEGKRNSQ